MPRRTTKVTTFEQMIGGRISQLRKQRGLSQTELAKRIGLSQSVLSRHERGMLRLHGALVADLAKALQTTSDEILGLKEPKQDGPFSDRRFVRRLQQIEGLSKRKKEALLTTIDAFLRGERRP